MAIKQYKLKKIILFFVVLFLNNNIFAGEAYFDLSEKEIHIQTDFNGKDIIIFGILEAEEDTIISIKGPNIDTKISKKGRIFGFWFNSKKIVYKKLPSIFFISSSSPIKNILNKETLIKEKLYFDDLLTNSITQRNFIPKKKLKEWDKNLIRIKKNQNFYKEYKLKNIENKLFQTRVFFPAESIPGNYEVTTYQIKNKIILSKKNRVIIIKKSGIGDKIYKFAHEKSSTYGILSIIFAILSGFIAATVFRRL
jgi:uncharacterized protein (TIGR02186 family)|tara:strand:+ start:296 stop:1051 length:756 start_codon:yes stop_codon:yes gene_type:complete